MYSVHGNQTSLETHLELLSQIEPTDVNFLTCYLDTRGSRWQTQANFRNMQLTYRQTLSDRQQVDFDHAVKMVEVFLESLDENTESIMIFCRGILGGQYFLTIPMPVPLGNSIVFQSTPAIMGLTEMLEHDHDTKPGQHWNINLQLNKSRDYHHQALSGRHLESDENSYTLAHDEHNWPAGIPVALRDPKAALPVKSVDLMT